MADQDQQGKVCPNCGPGTKTHGGEKGTICEQCGGTFTYVAGEPKLAAVGELDRVKADVEELKKRLPAAGLAALPSAGPDDPEDGEEEDDDDDQDL